MCSQRPSRAAPSWMASRPPSSRAGVFAQSFSGPNRSATRSAWTYIPRAYNSRIGARSAVGMCIRLPSAPGPLLPFGIAQVPGRVRQRPEHVNDVTQLTEPHPVPVEEFAQGELLVEVVGIHVGQAGRHLLQQPQERPLN